MAEQPRAACVIGWPVEHSRSPLIHNYWLKQQGIDGDYRREAVRPEDLPAFIRSLEQRGYVGGNCTIPHKEAVLALSQPDERALAVGAANTIWLDKGELRSTNSDIEGFLGNLDEAAPGWDKRLGQAVVLGAGGAARAIVFGLVERGVERIHIVNRTLSRAQDIVGRYGDRIVASGWEGLNGALKGAGLLVNTTSLGMHNSPPLEVDLAPLSADAVVCDIVYVPLETGLLKTARARDLRTCDGLGMLLHQAVRGFELWFGVRPTVTRELRALAEREIVEHAAARGAPDKKERLSV